MDAQLLDDRPVSFAWPFKASVGAPLAALDGDSLSRRFHVWRTASGQRLVCTVFRVDDDEAAECLEDSKTAVVIGAAVDCFGLRRMTLVIGPDECGRPSLADLHRDNPDIQEWHVHLLAQSCEDARKLAARLRSAACI